MTYNSVKTSPSLKVSRIFILQTFDLFVGMTHVRDVVGSNPATVYWMEEGSPVANLINILNS